MTENQEQESGTTADAAFTPAYARYVLGVLFLVYVFNFIDRQILAILLEDIKADLGVSDSAMGFLTGFAFALFYTVAGLPIARWADVGVRRSIIALGLSVWSVMTALSGVAQNFLQLALARIGVGVGEAAGSPPAHSLIADYFPLERRATALSIYNMGISVGILFGLVAGGWLNDIWGWRVAFFIVGVPGLALAVLVRLTVREPPRGGTEGTTADEPPLPIAEVFGFLWSLRSFRHLAIAAGLHAFTGYGFATWGPTFLRRVHDASATEAGTALGLIIGLGGIAGAYLGGVMSDRMGRKDLRYYLWIPAVSAFATLPFTTGFLLLESQTLALIAYAPSVVFGAMWLGAILAVTQGLVKLRMRAVASAVLFLIINLIGLGLGPQAVGIVNDLLASEFGDHASRYSLLLSTVMTAWSGVHFFLAARSVREDMQAKEGL